MDYLKNIACLLTKTTKNMLGQFQFLQGSLIYVKYDTINKNNFLGPFQHNIHLHTSLQTTLCFCLFEIASVLL